MGTGKTFFRQIKFRVNFKMKIFSIIINANRVGATFEEWGILQPFYSAQINFLFIEKSELNAGEMHSL